MSAEKRCTSCGNVMLGGYRVDRPCCGGAMCVGCCDAHFGTFMQGSHCTCAKCPSGHHPPYTSCPREAA